MQCPLMLDPWGFCVYCAETRKLRPKTIEELQLLLDSEIVVARKSGLILPFVKIKWTRKENITLWPDAFRFFGKTMMEAIIKIHSLREILLEFDSKCVVVLHPNGSKGFITQSYDSKTDTSPGFHTYYTSNYQCEGYVGQLSQKEILQSFRQKVMGHQWKANKHIYSSL
jgi:hypothetical protein